MTELRGWLLERAAGIALLVLVLLLALVGRYEEGGRPMQAYSIQYAAAIVVAVIAAMLGAAMVASDALELSRQQVAIIGVVTAGLTVLASFLPRVTKPPSDAREGMD